MDKKDIQKRVLQNGENLSLEKFEWDEKAKVFSSIEDNLVIDFSNIEDSTIKAGNHSTIKAWSRSTIDAGEYSTIKAGNHSTIDARGESTIDAGHHSTIKAWHRSTIKAWSRSTIDAGDESTIDAGGESTIKAGHSSTIKAWSRSTIDAGSYSTIDAGHRSTIDAGGSSTIDAGDESTIDAGHHSTIKAGHHSTIDAWGDNIVIINRNVFEVILPKKNDTIQICPHKIKGHLVNGLYNGEPHIIADSILSKIISKKGNLYKVINHNQDKISYLIESEIDNKKIYSHGATIKEARESLVYKLSNRDTSKYNSLNLDSILIRDEAIQCYMTITGACGAGTKYFIDNLDKVKKEYSIKEIINLTKNQFGNEKFKEFFKK